MTSSFPSWTSWVRIPSPSLDASRFSRSISAYHPTVGCAAWKSKTGSTDTTLDRNRDRHMSVPSAKLPKYRHYKPKNLAVVRINGHDVYLGRFDSPESHEKYRRTIAEWLTTGQAKTPTPADPPASAALVNEAPRPEAEVSGRPPRGGRFRPVAPFGGGHAGKAPGGPATWGRPPRGRSGYSKSNSPCRHSNSSCSRMYCRMRASSRPTVLTQ